MRADIRNPVIAKIIGRERVDTVVHMSVLPTANRVDGQRHRISSKEFNVIGTMQLLAACQQAPDVENVIIKSSAGIYGASSRDPAMFTEEMSARHLGSGFTKDVADIESYARSFARRRPDVRVVTLRSAGALGPDLATPLSTYFRLPLIPTVLGFDPRLQFISELDLMAALTHAIFTDAAGTFNLAGDGVIMLSQAIRRLGKPSVALPSCAVAPVRSLLRGAQGVDFSPEQIAYLTYGRGLDTSRMREVLGFAPQLDTSAVFERFVAGVASGWLPPQRVQELEERVAHALRLQPESERRSAP